MTELDLKLAHPINSFPIEGFKITAKEYATPKQVLEGDLKNEGVALADLLFDCLPGGTLVEMIERLRFRYSESPNQDWNPFNKE